MEREKIPKVKDPKGPLPEIGRNAKSQFERVGVRLVWVALWAFIVWLAIRGFDS